MQQKNVHIPALTKPERLDRALGEVLPDLSRSRLQALIKEGQVTVNGKLAADVALKVKGGEAVEIIIPEVVESHAKAQNIPLEIVFEDAHMLVINKPAGLTVHPAPGHPDSTLVNALLAHCGDSLSGIGGVARPGIVHRLDKDTSGLMVVAKHDAAHAHLSAQLSTRTLTRIYLALVWGEPKVAKGTVSTQIGRSPTNRQKMAVLKTGGRDAVTHYAVKVRFTDEKGKVVASLVECKLETGRTHQIRVHMAHLGCSLVGDPAYGPATRQRLQGFARTLPQEEQEALRAFKRQALHAWKISFVHPHTLKEQGYDSELPADMQNLLEALK